jgi:hypothetical protein
VLSNYVRGHEANNYRLENLLCEGGRTWSVGRNIPRPTAKPTSTKKQTMLSAIAVLVFSLLVGRIVQAQESAQDPRVGEAKTACVAGDFQKGVRLLAEIYMETNDPIWIFNQGRCYHQNAQPTLALSRFQEFLRKSQGAPQEDIRDAQKYIAEIEGEPRPKQPAAGATATSSTDATSVSTESQTAPPERGRGLRYAGIGVGILGAAALASGVVFSVLVSQTNNKVESQTKTDVVNWSVVSGEYSDGPRYVTLQWISYGVGAAAVLTGGVLYWLGTSSKSAKPRVASTCVSPLFLAHGAGATLHMAF